MSFLSSIFLWALPLAAVPVVIHLLNRRRRQVVRWGAMHLLMESIPRRRRIWRFDDLLLMLLRALAVAAIVLALARPQLRSALFSGTAPGRDVILVIDDSLSTGRMHNGAPVFDAVKAKAAALLDTLEESDRIRLMLAAANGHWLAGDGITKSNSSHATLAEKIAELKPTLATADIPGCVQTALQAEPSSNATGRLIVIVTDGTAHGWNVEAGSQWQTIRETVARAAVPTALNVVKVDAPTEPLANMSIEEITTNRTRVAASEPFTVTAHVRNNSTTPHEPSTLKWRLDGESQGDSPVARLEPGQTLEVSFETSCAKPGAFELGCTLEGADDLPQDNSASIVIDSIEKLPILICRTEADLAKLETQPDFLKAALGLAPKNDDGPAALSVFDPTIVAVDALAGIDLSRFRCVVLDDVLPAAAAQVDTIADFVHKGGGLWLILGDNVTPEQFNALFYRDGGGVSPIALDKRIEADADSGELISIHPPEGTHPATVLLGDTERLDIDDVRIKRHWKLPSKDAGDEFSVVLETGEGEPLAGEHLLGEGRIMLQSLAFNNDWSNLPVCQAFVPLVHEWVWYLTQPTATAFNLNAGTPIVVDAETAAETKEATLVAPTGEKTKLLEADAKSAGPLRYRGTAFPGIYQVTLVPKKGDERTVPYAVRRDADESRIAPLTDVEFASLSTAGGLRFDVDPLSLPATTSEVVGYEPFWTYLLGFVVLLFFAEIVFAYLMTRNRYADAWQPAVPTAPVAAGSPEVTRQSA